MNEEQQLFAGMGDLSGMMNDKPQIVDLSWLDVEPGSYDNIPSHNNPHNVIPQLEAAWGMENLSSPTSFIPNQVLSGKAEIVEIGPENIAPVVMVAKRAMMQGLKGDQIMGHLKERFPMEQLKAASSELKKVASEQGLLGTVYLDLSAFESTREAQNFVSQGRIRLASFAIGAPTRDANFLSEGGMVRDLGLKHVASVEYTPELLAKYAETLKGAGAIESDATIGSREDLQQAVVAGKVASVRERTLEARPYQGIDNKQASEILQGLSMQNKQAAEAQAAQVRIASVRPVLASMQAEMLKGKMGQALREVIASKYPESLIKEFAPEISKLASMQGLMGKLYADVSLFDTADHAIQAIRTASVRPTYIVTTTDTGDNRLARVASATGCAPMPKSGPSVKEASELVSSLSRSGQIPSQAASVLQDRLASGDHVTNVIRDAHITAATHIPEIREGGIAGNMQLGEVAAAPTMDPVAIKTAAMAALTRGFPVSKVQAKVASMVSAGEAVSLVRSAIASIDTVPSISLERCTTERYGLASGAKIASSLKCASCVYSTGGFCSKQAAKLVDEKAVKTASVATVDPSAEYNLRTASIRVQVSPSASFDAGAAIRPAQDIFGSSNTLDGYFR